MADSPDLDALARRYLDFWEEQAAAISADPAMADLVARLFGAFAPGGAGLAGFAAAAHGFGPSSPDHERSGTTDGDGTPGQSGQGADRQGADGQGADGQGADGQSGPGGPAAAGAASVADDDRLDELLRRIAALEERIAALEAGGRPAGSRARGKSQKG